MGGEESKPPQPPPLTDVAWRKTEDWNEGVKHELLKEVADLAPDTPEHIQVPFYNILLTGQIKAGKSSFFNSIYTVFNEKVAPKAEVGEAAKSLTKEFMIYEVKRPKQRESLSWRICDTMGLDIKTTDETDVRNILKAVDGNVPNKFVFHDKEFVSDDPQFIKDPSLADKAHCVAVVVDASLLTMMNPEMWRKLRSLRSGLISRKVPTFILLTHIDKACEETLKDVKNVYNSIVIRDHVESVGKKLMGLPENQIFPVKNYQSEVRLDTNMDILVLYALRQMLYSAQAHLENKCN